MSDKVTSFLPRKRATEEAAFPTKKKIHGEGGGGGNEKLGVGFM